MPANLPAEARAAWERYLKATTVEEKIRALEEFIAAVPKHKGTEKLLKQVKQKLTKLRLELAKQREARRGGAHPAFSIPKEEDAQIVLLGVPGSGKTALFNYLTGAGDVLQTSTTVLPSVGAFKYSGAIFQLVDLPPVTSPRVEEIPNGRSIMNVVRNSDLVLLVIDLTQPIDWQLNMLLSALRESRIIIDRNRPPIRFQRLSSGGIQVYGIENSPFTVEELKDILASAGVINARIDILGPVDEEDIVNALDRRTVFKPAIIVATKGDAPGSYNSFEELKMLVGGAFRKKIPIIPASAVKKKGKEELGSAILKELSLIRIWLKKDGKVDERALVLRKGSTVRDAALRIHSDFVKKFRFAILERKGDKVPRKRVGLDFQLRDNDILTIYVRE